MCIALFFFLRHSFLMPKEKRRSDDDDDDDGRPSRSPSRERPSRPREPLFPTVQSIPSHFGKTDYLILLKRGEINPETYEAEGSF